MGSINTSVIVMSFWVDWALRTDCLSVCVVWHESYGFDDVVLRTYLLPVMPLAFRAATEGRTSRTVLSVTNSSMSLRSDSTVLNHVIVR